MSPRWLLCALALPLASCGLFQQSAYQEQGLASYVADIYIGRPTASGQPYQPYNYTAAHNSLPLGTRVTVTNQQTGQSVNVVVNDRFPYYPGRVINLSSAAAQALGIPYMRMAQVQVTARNVSVAQPSTAYGYQGQPPQPRTTYRQPGPGPGAPAYTGGNAPPPGLKTF
ncbi:MAG: septal ring lytic transglycosylase RlpA family protein [Prosthecobacter sp.]|nr:septal ring lytic transglycosylase RlpA family protein [Prosthecobacter sp.]